LTESVLFIIQLIMHLLPILGVLNLFFLHYLAFDFYMDLVKERFLGRKLTASKVYGTIGALTMDEADKDLLPFYVPRALRGIPDDVWGRTYGMMNFQP
jgi:hypothetical protein